MTAIEPRVRRDATGPDAPVPPDWAALLPGGRLGSVAVVGPVTRSAHRAQQASSTARPDQLADTVIVTDDRASALRTAMALVRPGGAIRVERSRRRRRARTRWLLRQRGLIDVTTWWARPDIDHPRCLIRLEDRVAAATVVRTVADRRRRTPLEVAVAWSGVADLLAREVSIMAMAPGPCTERALAGPADGRRIDALVTPGYRRSRAVIGIATDGTGRRLHSVAKVARRPEDDGHVAAEAAVLEDLERRAGGFAGAPQEARVDRRAGRSVLVERAVPGEPLDRRAVRRDPVGALVVGRRWIDGLPRHEATVPAEDGRAEALLRGPLTAVAARPGIRAATVEVASEVLGRIERVPLPVVFEHGDLGHPNLLVEDGTLAAVDWERARPDGLPLHDLVFLVAYLTESLERSGGAEQLGRAVVRALRPHGWARPELDVHVERLALDRSLIPALQVACWTRHLAARPVDMSTDGAPSREEALWMAAVDAAVGRW
ncbi:hypothetical protein HC251_07225 [Iamia sp. SCSIO 61187]|uniref:hypothetical protein n=1 Tax=Iamia sp. SCSIO 61187 TaxID=2722752 RepID=UPI001C627870|nr:hypothetical protein [Iamia sp. SCSIO 61187]QYG92248.1 hypothetical protein HC251_07225 [Iamia sp. SCSIO 61187]